MCTLSPTTRHTVTHTYTQTVHCRAVGSVMASPEHVCVVANALRQGTWLTTAPKGARHQRRAHAANCSQHQTSFQKGNSTQRTVILQLSASITVTFSNHLHASIHLTELELNCHHHLWSQGFERKCSTIRHNIRFSIPLMTANESGNIELIGV